VPISRNRGTSFEPEIIRSHNLLPIDMQIKPSRYYFIPSFSTTHFPKRLNNLFQRGLNYKKDHDLNSIKNEDNWSSWSRDLDEKQTELIDPNVQNEIQQDLGLIFGTLNQVKHKYFKVNNHFFSRMDFKWISQNDLST